MPHALHILLRILAGIAGALLLYVAFFLYEDEEARIQNRLEEIWKRIDALHSSAISKEAAFLQGVTQTITEFLDDLLGPDILSTRAIGVSMAFSLGSFLLWNTFGPVSTASMLSPATIFWARLLFIVGVFVVLTRIEKKASRSILNGNNLIILGLLCSIFFVYGFVGMNPEEGLGLYLALGIVVFPGFWVDVLFIAFFRWVLKAISSTATLWTIIGCLVAVATVGLLLSGPAILASLPRLHQSFAFNFETVADDRFFNRPHSLEHLVIFVLCQVSTTNLVDALCLALLTAMITILLVHRLLWPLIKRPIYAANRKQLIKNTKLLGALGTMLLLYAFPNNPLVKWITGFLPNLKG